MRLFEFRADYREKPLDQRLGETRIGGAGFRDRHRAGQHAHADEELLLLPEDARAVERVLIGARLRELQREPLAQLVRRSARSSKKAGSISASSTRGRCEIVVGELRRRAQ